MIDEDSGGRWWRVRFVGSLPVENVSWETHSNTYVVGCRLLSNYEKVRTRNQGGKCVGGGKSIDNTAKLTSTIQYCC